MEAIKVQAVITVEPQRVEDLLIGAYEGGSHYWARANGGVTDIMLGREVEIRDVEDGELLGTVNQQNIQNAFQYMANGKDKTGKEIPLRHWQNFVNEDDDAETADVFLQLAVMGEIVFG